MDYDPIKKDAGRFFNCCRASRILFFRLLNLLLLRSWHVRREIRGWAKTAPPGAAVLDAGSGFGQYVWFVSKLKGKYRVKGVDVKQEETDLCNRFPGGRHAGGRVRFEKADLNSFSEPQTYDLILCVDVLEHITDDVKVMKNLYGSLKGGGMLLISTPSDRGGSDVHDEGGNSFIGEHVRDGYGWGEITEKLSLAGFDKTEVRYSYGRWGQMSWKISMKYPVKMVSAGRIFFLVLPLYYLVTFPVALLLNFFDLYGRHSTGTGLIVKAYKLSDK
ncbi:MAG: class I SAM-dependent methyltransferase [Bacteroidales bacterium]